MHVKSVLLLGLSLLLLAGCGSRSTEGNSSTLSTSATATEVPRLTPGASPVATRAPQVTPAPGQVTLQLSASTFRVHEAIVVTISNQTAHAISFADHQSNCTVVLLQRQTGSSWQVLNPCELLTPTQLLLLAAGQHQTISLQSGNTPWQTGVYRIVFRYGEENATSSGTATLVSSPLFHVDFTTPTNSTFTGPTTISVFLHLNSAPRLFKSNTCILFLKRVRGRTDARVASDSR